MTNPSAQIRHDEDRSRYELVVDGELIGVADYHDTGGALVFPHTEIDMDRRGMGWGQVLVQAAMDDVRTKGRIVVPQCWYVREFLDTHPEYSDLRAA